MAAGLDDALKSTGLILSGNLHAVNFSSQAKEYLSYVVTDLGCWHWAALSEKLYVIKGGCGAGRYFWAIICHSIKHQFPIWLLGSSFFIIFISFLNF